MFIVLNIPVSHPSNNLCDELLSVWQNAEFRPLQTFGVGKQRFFPLQISGARGLGRMLFRTSLFGQDPGMKLSAAGSSHNSLGHSSRGEYLTQPS